LRRVVITGIGPACANGIGKNEFWKSILQKEIILNSVKSKFEKIYSYKSRFFVPSPEINQDGMNSTMSEMAKIALTCAKLAAEDANITDGSEAGVILGVGINDLKNAFESYNAHIKGEGRFNRMIIPMLMPNSVSSWIAISLGTRGMNYTVNAACASGNIAIGEAFSHIKNGDLDMVLTGGVDCLDDGEGAIMRGFDMLGVLTNAGDGHSRPFSSNRSGFLFNMGAGCVLILEELEKAKSRGADIYAEIVDYKANCDGYTIIQMDPDGKSILSLFDMIKNIDIDYLNAHGTGTVQNDEIEAKIIKKVWGQKQPLINSTKGIIGHSIGASAALEAAVAALSIKNGIVHGNLTDNTIENLNLPIDTTEAKIEYALTASYGFGGHNSLLLLKRYKDV